MTTRSPRRMFAAGLGAAAMLVAAPLAASATAPSPVAAAPQPAMAEPVSLSMKMKPGWTLSQELTSTNRVEQTMQGMAMNFATTMIIDFTHRVRPDAPVQEGGVVSMESVITRMRLDLAVPMQPPMKADSADPEALAGNPQAAMIQPMLDVVGKPMRYELTARGKLLKGPGMDAVVIGLPGQGSPASVVLAQMIPQLPTAPVGAGDVWDQKVPAEPPLPGEITLNWTMQKLDAGMVAATLESSVDLDGEEIEPQPGMKANVTMKGSQKGSAMIDVATGWMHRLESTQTMAGTITVNAGPAPMQIPMSSTSSSKLRTVPTPAAAPAGEAAPAATGG